LGFIRCAYCLAVSLEFRTGGSNVMDRSKPRRINLCASPRRLSSSRYCHLRNRKFVAGKQVCDGANNTSGHENGRLLVQMPRSLQSGNLDCAVNPIGADEMSTAIVYALCTLASALNSKRLCEVNPSHMAD
jgi:hypothetical protein